MPRLWSALSNRPSQYHHPFILAYKTKDDRFIQIACLRRLLSTFISCIGRPDLAEDARYTRLQVAKNNRSLNYMT